MGESWGLLGPLSCQSPTQPSKWWHLDPSPSVWKEVWMDSEETLFLCWRCHPILLR